MGQKIGRKGVTLLKCWTDRIHSLPSSVPREPAAFLPPWQAQDGKPLHPRFRRRYGLHLRAGARRNGRRRRLNFHIVETPAICQAAAEVFGGDPRIHFHPRSILAREIRHRASGLLFAYIDDWQSLIRKLATYQPAYFLS